MQTFLRFHNMPNRQIRREEYRRNKYELYILFLIGTVYIGTDANMGVSKGLYPRTYFLQEQVELSVNVEID